MPTDYTIIDSPNALIVNVTKRRAIWEGAVGAIAFAVFLAATANFWHTSKTVMLGMTIFGALAGWILAFRTRRASLIANNLDFVTRGTEGTTRPGEGTISRASIEAFFYDENPGGGNENDTPPPGLYARVGRSSSCIVPFVNESQANEIITLLYQRFPDMPIKTIRDGGLTTLKL